jgi:predicted MFS family arabinose efflux permease
LGTLSLSREISHFAISLVIAGIAGAALQLSIARILTEAIPWQRQGIAFGIKQAAVPLGTLVSGVAVAVAATQFGWRITTAATGILVLGGALLVMRWSASVSDPRPPRAKTKIPNKRALFTLGFIGACGGFSGTSMATFVVEFLAESSVDVWVAGVVLAIASFVTVCARVGLGWFLDRQFRQPASIMAFFMALGGAMLAILWLPMSPLTLGIVVVFAYAMAWSWPGALLYLVARLFPTNVASASGVVQGFVWTGATLGPMVSGLVITIVGFHATWIFLGLVLLMGTGILITNSPSLRVINHPAPPEPQQGDAQ